MDTVPPLVLVDAENVRRSRWPNIPANELVELCNAWAARQGVEVEVVFEAEESADDRIALRADELAVAGRAYWLVTSDRGLRGRAGAAAERVVGGGSFASELTARGAVPEGWSEIEGALEREFRFDGFLQALAFVNRVAELAEAADHHPDIAIHYNRVTLRWWTHTTGGITERDRELASRTGELA